MFDEKIIINLKSGTIVELLHIPFIPEQTSKQHYISNIIISEFDLTNEKSLGNHYGQSSFISNINISDINEDVIVSIVFKGKKIMVNDSQIIFNEQLGYCKTIAISNKKNSFDFLKTSNKLKKRNVENNKFSSNIEEKKPNGYYVYIFVIKHTNTPFYVGKGCGNRYKKTKRNNACNRVWDNNECDVVILKDNLTEKEALILESQKIKEFSKNGIVLTNILD
jgi:Uncharacterized protein conserved in bacteria